MKACIHAALLFIGAGVLSACGDKDPSATQEEAGVAADAVPVATGLTARIGVPPEGFGLADRQALRKLKLSKGRCFIDSIDGTKTKGVKQVALSGRSQFEAKGWSVNGAGAGSPEFVLLLTGPEATYGLVGTSGLFRKDVARALGNDAAANSGFSLQSAAPVLTPGEYSLSIIQDDGGSVARCRLPFKLVVGNPRELAEVKSGISS